MTIWKKKFFAIIREIDADKTLAYILNATKAFLNDKITLSIYFRICHVVLNTLEEDLQFLKAHINDAVIPYSVEVGGLMTAGLAYHTDVGEDNIPRYNFTELAKLISNCAINGTSLTNISEFSLNDPDNIQSIFDGTYEPIKNSKK